MSQSDPNESIADVTERIDPDQELVDAAQDGNTEAFRELYERHRSFVFHLIYRMIGNREDALDLVQEVFIKAHRGLPNFEGKSQFRTWLGRISHNATIDFCKKKRIRVSVSLDARNADDEKIGLDPGEDDDPSEALTGQELRDQLNDAMGHLSEAHREVLSMYATGDLTYQEIAETLDINVGTVMSRLFYARQQLKKLMEPYLATEVQDG